MNLKKAMVTVLVGVATCHCVSGSQIVDFGAGAPTPGPSDIAQLAAGTITAATKPDGLNYYSDNGTPPGQTFTTGSNPTGYLLNALYVKTGGSDSGGGGTGAQAYTLRIYSVTGNAATLISTYVTANTVAFTDGDWLEYTGLTNVLQPNTVYAYSHHRNTAGWDGLSVVGGDLLSGGEAVLIPAAGGNMTMGASHAFDGTFDVALTANVPPNYASVSSVTVSPTNNPLYAGTQVTLSATATGNSPLTFIWQTDNGTSGATFSNLPGSNTNVYVLDTTNLNSGTYQYQLIVTNAVNSATSSVVTLNLNAASAPFIVSDTTAQPASAFVGLTVTLNAAFDGTQPIAYQWMFTDTNGIGPAPVPGATGRTLTIPNVQLANAGTYSLTASNSINGGYLAASTPVSVSVATAPAWVINFAYRNPGGNGGALFNGAGVVRSGTYWNQLTGTWTGDQRFNTGVSSVENVTTLADDGGTDLQVGMTVECTGNYFSGTDNLLLNKFMMVSDHVTSHPFSFNNVPDGTYSVVLYGCSGHNHSATTTWTINGVSLTATNASDTTFVQNDNYVMFTGVVASGGTISGTWIGARNGTGGAGETGAFNGAQLLFLGSGTDTNPPPVTLNIQNSPSGVVLTWPQGTLLQATDATGPYSPVGGATSPYTNAPTAPQTFYRLQIP